MNCKGITIHSLRQDAQTKEWYFAQTCPLSPCDEHTSGQEIGRINVSDATLDMLVSGMVAAFYKYQDNKYLLSDHSGKIVEPRKVKRAYAFIERYFDCGDARWDSPALLPEYDEKSVRPELIRELCALQNLVDNIDNIADRRMAVNRFQHGVGEGQRTRRRLAAQAAGKQRRRIIPLQFEGEEL